ncbi:MAG: glycine cleavage system protein [Pseudomonadota bacterium]
MTTESLQRTPLFDVHVKLGGRIVPFAGWELPIWYSSIIAEHTAVRTAAGLFDVSHMGELFVEGPEAEKLIDHLTCNDVKKIADGRAQYNALLNEAGGVVDDIIVYRYSSTRYLICVNASNAEKDFAWFQRHNTFQATVTNRSHEFGQIALQGPRSVEIMQRLSGGAEAVGLQYFSFADLTIAGIPVTVARTGYTGEDGFEIFVPWNRSAELWEALLVAGEGSGLVPAGLGARDSLRLEACLPLHGHEINDDIPALESGLGWIVKFDKGDFIGREALLKIKNGGTPRGLVGYVLEDAGIARQGDALTEETGRTIGLTTSGTKTPTVNRAIGLAIVESKYTAVDTPLHVEVRGRRLKCRVVKRPFYKRPQ